MTESFKNENKNTNGTAEQAKPAAPKVNLSGIMSVNDEAISDRPRPAHEVTVDHNVEKAMRVLKRKLIREGLFKELKLRRYYEKPCERKKRKDKESMKRIRKEEARQKKFMNGLV